MATFNDLYQDFMRRKTAGTASAAPSSAPQTAQGQKLQELYSNFMATADERREKRLEQERQRAQRAIVERQNLPDLNAIAGNLVRSYNSAASGWQDKNALDALQRQIEQARRQYTQTATFYNNYGDIMGVGGIGGEFSDWLNEMQSGLDSMRNDYGQYADRAAWDQNVGYSRKYAGKSVGELENAYTALGGKDLWTTTKEGAARKEDEISRELADAQANLEATRNNPRATQDEQMAAVRRYDMAKAESDRFERSLDPEYRAGIEQNAQEAQWIRNYIDSGSAAYYAGAQQYGVDLYQMTPYQVVQWADDPSRTAEQKKWAQNYMADAAAQAQQFGAADYRNMALLQHEYEQRRGELTDQQRNALDAAIRARLDARDEAETSGGYIVGPTGEATVDMTPYFASSNALDEVQAYAALMGISYEEAQDEVDRLSGWTQYQEEQEYQRSVREKAAGKGGGIYTVKTWVTQPFANWEARLATWGSALSGDDLSSADPMLREYLTNQNIRQERAQVWANNPALKGKKIFGQDAGAYIYNTVNSMVDSWVNRQLMMGATAGLGIALDSTAGKVVGALVSDAVMGSGAAAQTYIDYVSRGYSPQQALAASACADLTEAITEWIGGEAVMNHIIAENYGIKGAIKQFMSEGLEELAGNWVNDAFQAWALKDPEAQERVWDRVQALTLGYVRGGMNPEKALEQALKDTVVADAGDFVAGGLAALGDTVGSRAMRAGSRAVNDYQTGRQMIREGYRNAANVQTINDSLASLPNARRAAQVSETSGAYAFGRAVRQSTQARTESNAAQAVDELQPKLEQMLASQSDRNADAATVAARGVISRAVAKQMVQGMIPSDMMSDRMAQTLELTEEEENAAKSKTAQSLLLQARRDLGSNLSVIASLENEQVRDKLLDKESADQIQKGQDPGRFAADKRLTVAAAKQYGVEQREAGLAAAKSQKTTLTDEQVEAIYDRAARNVETAKISEDGKIQLPDGVSTRGIQAIKSVFYAIDKDDTSAREDFSINALGTYNLALGYGGTEYAQAVLESVQKAYPGISQQLQEVFDRGLQERRERGLYVAEGQQKNTVTDADRAARKAGTITADDAKKYGVNTVDFDRIEEINGRNGRQMAQQAVRMAQRLSRVLNVNIVFFDSRNAERQLTGNANGWFDRASGTVYLDITSGLDNGGSVTFTLAHELTHVIAARAQSEFQAMEDFIVDYYYKNRGGREGYVKEIQAIMGTDTSIKTEDDAREELVARSCENMLTDTQAIRTLYQQNRKLFGVISRAVDRFVRAFNKVVQWMQGDTRASSRYARALDESAEALRKMQQLWDAALMAAAERGDAEVREATAEAKENAAQGGVKFSTKNEVLSLRNVDWDEDNESTIKEQLAAHRDVIASRGVIARITYNGEQGNALVKAIMDQVPRIGGQRISRSGVVFDFDEEGAKEVKRHADSSEERAAAILAPYAAKYGRLITGHKNHKGRNYPTLTYAGLFEINGVQVSVGVAIQFSRNGRPQAIEIGTDTIEGYKKLREALRVPNRRTTSSEVTVLSSTESFSASNVPQEKNSVKTNDADYLAAVERGDMETAQRMVDEAAKAAGYDSPMLYHGTNKYGFTRFDTQKSDDGISLFTTSSLDMAQTYSGRSEVKRISEHALRESAGPDEIIRALKETPMLYDARFFAADDIDGKHDFANMIAERLFRQLNERAYFDTGNETAAELWAALGDLKRASDRQQIIAASRRLYDAVVNADLYWRPDVTSDTAMELTNAINMLRANTESYWYLADFHNREAAQITLEKQGLYRGNYALFGRLDGMLELTGKGQNWNRVPISGEIRKAFSGESYASTREIARYAKDNGYTGVLIRGITDNGGRGAEAEAGDVYIFFDGANLKSADPVTYDDAGNVIPLSERFNRDDEDIRFSRKSAEPESEQMEALRKELQQRTQETRDLTAELARTIKARGRETGAWKKAVRAMAPQLWAAEAERIAKQIIRDANSTADEEEIRAQLRRMGDTLLTMPEDGTDTEALDTLMQQARELAQTVVQTAQTTEAGEYYDLLRGYFQHQKIYFPRTLRSDITPDSWTDWLRGLPTGLRVVSSSTVDRALPVDTTYQELQGQFGEILFPADIINQAEQLQRIVDVMRQEQTRAVNPFGNTQADQRYAVDGLAADYLTQVDDRITALLERIATPGGAAVEASKAGIRAARIESTASRQADVIADLREEIDLAKWQSEREKQRATALVQNLRNELRGADSQLRILRDRLDGQKQKIAETEKSLQAEQRRVRTLERQMQAETEKHRDAIARLRAQKNARMDELLEKEQERHREAMRKLRQQKNARAEEMYQEAMERGRQRLRDYRIQRDQSAAVKKYRGRIESDVKDLLRLVTENSDKRHVPDQLRQPLAEFLQSIDVQSAQASEGGPATRRDQDWARRFERLTAALNAQRADELEGKSDANLYLPDDFYELMNKAADAVRVFTERYGGTELYGSDAETLRDLSKVLQILNHAVREANNTMVNNYAAKISELGELTMEQLRPLGTGKTMNRAEGWLNNLIFWQNGTPYYVFKRFGEAGFSTFQAIMDGQGKLAAIAEKIIQDSRTMFESSEVKEWQNEVHEVELSNDRTVRMTTAQLMSFYCLSKRQQAVGHLLGGGMKIDAFKDGRRTVDDRTDYVLGVEDIQTINGLLTDRQREVADAIQRYMSTYGSELGNEVSMRRFGYKAYGEANYFPIVSDRQNLDGTKEEEQRASLLRLLNMSHTKSLVDNANNALVVQNIFDVFSNHMSDMAEYNALALPVLDMVRWFNYKNRQDAGNGQIVTDTVQKSLATAFGGVDTGGGNVRLLANEYVKTFLKDLNGNNERGRDIGIGNLMGKYKRASVAANLRVAIQQPMSIMRASAVLDPKWLAKGIADAAKAPRETSEELSRYSNEAKWKDQGHHDIYIGRSVAQQIKNDQSVWDRAVERSMVLAEIGDKVTWTALWAACKAEQQGKGLSGEALMDATARRFQEVVYATQVMDATTTRSQSMRSNSPMNQMWTAFMAEPTLSLNLLVNTWTQYRLEARRGGDTAEARKKAFRATYKVALRAIAAYSFNALAVTLAESLIDAFRDDDDYETFVDKYLSALGENWWEELDPLRKITVLKDVINLFTGKFGAGDRMDMAALVSVKDSVDVMKEWYDVKFKGADPTETTYYGKMTPYGKIYKLLKATSQITGIPFAGASREFQTVWNNMIYPGLKAVGVNEVHLLGQDLPLGRLKTYDESAKNIGYPKLYDAIVDGDEKTALRLRQEMYYNGISDEDVVKGLKEQIKTHFTAGDIEEDEAKRMLVEYCGYEVLGTGEDSLQSQIDKWAYGTGYKLSVRLADAFGAADADAVREAVNYMRTAYYMNDSTIKSAVSSYWHEQYTAGADRALIRRMLMATRLYSAADVDKLFKTWDKNDAKKAEEAAEQERREAAARADLLGA